MKNVKSYEDFVNEKFTKTGPASDEELSNIDFIDRITNDENVEDETEDEYEENTLYEYNIKELIGKTINSIKYEDVGFGEDIIININNNKNITIGCVNGNSISYKGDINIKNVIVDNIIDNNDQIDIILNNGEKIKLYDDDGEKLEYYFFIKSKNDNISIVNKFIDYLHNNNNMFYAMGDSKYEYDEKNNKIYLPLEPYDDFKNQFIEEIKNIINKNDDISNNIEIFNITDKNIILKIKGI